ncbi:hypothetical protein AWL63_10205 [Sphingomonas panacis]|uniref:Uncharacterized protein n=1 Tax=Sphingomonas panacis TaxID=1560345 RepID=A0A1B3ZA40_9SPHN|nr:hypothetical protein [Sphingomonas panacis]AOH84286.1 hypothetical protein AWL63_10205 [Sphingomonas panacis]
MGDFSAWLGRRGINLDRYGPEDEAAFIRGSVRRHSSKRRGERFVLDSLKAWLRETGIPFDTKPGKFRPDDKLMTFLNQL